MSEERIRANQLGLRVGGTLTTRLCDNTTWNIKATDQILEGLERESLAKRQGLPQGSIGFK